MVSSKTIRMEDKKIEAVKQWLEPQSIQDIQFFLGFANFYRQFIQRFNRIAAPLTLMLKTSSTKSAKPRKSRIGVGSDSKARHDKSEINRSRIDDVKVNGSKVGDDEVGKKS